MVLAYLILIAGCSPKKDIQVDTNTLTPTEIVRRVEANAGELASLRATGNLSIESRELSNSASCEVRMKRHDSLLIKITGPFGIKVASAFVTRKGFTFYDVLQNKVISGKTTVANIRAFLKFESDFDDVLDLFSGIATFRRENATPLSYGTDDGNYLLTFQRGSDTAKYWIDPEYFVVTKYQILNGVGEVFTEAKYSKFKQYGHLYLPRSIQMVREKEEQSLALFYERHEPNKPDLDFTFTVPANAERIRWE
jgi:outer membrane lipoprotein-sorting protein